MMANAMNSIEIYWDIQWNNLRHRTCLEHPSFTNDFPS